MLKIILYIILLALIHARLELMIEGKIGWALRLPCWRLDNKFIHFLLGKELTGYHFWMILMFILLFHSPFLFTIWTVRQEFFVMGTFFFYWILEDFFWFIESKHYGFKNFKKGRIFWHKRWVFGIPVSYLIAGIIGTLLFIGGIKC